MLSQISEPRPRLPILGRGPLVVLIEDDPVMGQSLIEWFNIEGYRTEWFRTGRDAIQKLGDTDPDVILCDIRLPDLTGEEIFKVIAPQVFGTPILFITGFGEIDQAVRLMKAGAADYMTKPFEIDALLQRIEKLIASRWALTEGYELGNSPAIAIVERQLRRLATVDSTVLLTGPSGAGKEVAARFLHAKGQRHPQPFMAINCAAIPAELLESEIFGHEKGAFTGSQARRIVYAEQAGDGILFLDEVADLPQTMQAKLLRLLQERTFMRVGGDRLTSFRARVIAATNADLTQRVKDGRFREDLYYRLAVIVVDIPALRARPEDILALANRFLGEFCSSFGTGQKQFSFLAEDALLAHDYPGNIRELRNRIERAVALAETDLIGPADLFPEKVHRGDSSDPVLSLQQSRDNAERRAILAALALTKGDVTLAAQRLDVSRSTLFEKIRRLDIRYEG
ncbi:MAG: sigma-54-dependent Fis family transcriptional regulator [Methylobacterium sp.]|nr:sigma-54-dependent Fis family transcriptional regulator [Methylobacterium sp.]